MKKKLVVIIGPTGSGKTKLAIQLAQQLRTEIVSADSRQVYAELRIGTARPTQEEMSQVAHHLIGHKSIFETYNATLFAKEANHILDHLFQKYDVVILCGGSGLYISALLEGLDRIPEVPEKIRKDLLAEYQLKGLTWLQNETHLIDPEWFAKADQFNHRRLLRCIEVFRAGGQRLSEFQVREEKKLDWEVLKYGLSWSTTTLYNRINQRVMEMVQEGLFQEAERWLPQRNLNALQTVGYAEVFKFIDGEITKDQAIQLIQQHTRNYAKRQMTWFKKEKDMIWLNMEDHRVIDLFLNTFKDPGLIHD